MSPSPYLSFLSSTCRSLSSSSEESCPDAAPVQQRRSTAARPAAPAHDDHDHDHDAEFLGDHAEWWWWCAVIDLISLSLSCSLTLSQGGRNTVEEWVRGHADSAHVSDDEPRGSFSFFAPLREPDGGDEHLVSPVIVSLPSARVRDARGGKRPSSVVSSIIWVSEGREFL